ncbi:MAG TPA: 4-alpha-glucanotransferase [Burkholderiaceae bacterium]|nr:4-alpha-glucanotransferase [Burkholderiaceae bacterium]
MTFDRRLSGILLHPTSLPGPHGSGDFGPSAYHFLDWLAAAGQSLWQILPLTPIGPGNSPYASVSAFAGSPLLVALEPLVERGWMAPADAAAKAALGPDKYRLDFGRVVPFRMQALRRAADGFSARASSAEREDFATFCTREAHWLDDYALFMALDTEYRARAIWSWTKWEPGLARRAPQALALASDRNRAAVAFWKFVQWCFFTQWRALKRYANDKGIRVVGDLPIFIAHHSADCWAHPDLFRLDANGEPQVIAGVPPDYFSPTGQRWGNPLYNWDKMASDGFAWWIARTRHELARADFVRIDHFRGFAAYWEIPASCPTAVEGSWQPAPGVALFDAIRAALGDLAVIAEDLGVITPDVEALRDRYALPGMKILQFAFGSDAAHAFLPHNYSPNCAVYTGTHDNDTIVGWYASTTDREREYARVYVDAEADGMHWAMIRAACASVARIAVYQMQDVLGLGAEHRMNTPSKLDCWTFRFDWDQVGPQPAERLARLAATYGRAPIERLNLPAYPAGVPRP